MTNIEKLARLIYKTGNADKIMAALALAVEVSVKTDNVRSKSPELCVGQVATVRNPSSLYQQVG